MKKWISLSVLVASTAAVACTSNNSPTAPSAAPTPTSAVLKVTLDGACQSATPRILSANVWIDGQSAGAVAAGGTITQAVPLGSHNVEATAYNIVTGQQMYHWSPYTVYVGPNGGSDLLYCQ